MYYFVQVSCKRNCHSKYVLSSFRYKPLQWMIYKRGRDRTLSYDKNTYTHRKIHKATSQHKKATQNFDYTRITDRLRTVSRATAVTTPVWFNRFTCAQSMIICGDTLHTSGITQGTLVYICIRDVIQE